MDKRQYSIPLDVHRISDYPEVQNVIHFLFSELKEAGLIKNSPRKKVLKHVKVVVLNLYIAYSNDPLIYVAYPRGSGAYGRDARLGKLHLGRDSMKKAVDSLCSLGYLENHVGFRNREMGFGYFSRMRATPRLIKLIQNHDVVSSMVSRLDDDVIVLRENDDEKEELSFEDSDEIVQMRDDLRSYNTFLQGFELGLSLPRKKVRDLLVSRECPPIDYTRDCLYRIFNGDFSSGGRFYRGWWQNIPRDLRKHITINGEPCSELDYSGQHVLLLYAREEDEYRWLKGVGDDPYASKIYGPNVRDLLKRAVLILVNASNRTTAVLAIRQKINFDFPELESNNAFINPLIDELMDNHPVIRQHFFSGSGGALQFQDSQIADYVLRHMQAWKQLVLPVHDSFVVRDKHIAQLFSIMKEAYRSLGIDSIPDVKPKLGANADMKNPGFTELWKLMDQERDRNEIEAESVKKLEAYV